MKGFPAERGTPLPWGLSPGIWLNPLSGSLRNENPMAILPFAGRTLPSWREGVPNLYPLRYVN
jgi:hypothetical protein